MFMDFLIEEKVENGQKENILLIRVFREMESVGDIYYM